LTFLVHCFQDSIDNLNIDTSGEGVKPTDPSSAEISKPQEPEPEPATEPVKRTPSPSDEVGTPCRTGDVEMS
jgi:hypothetical protein